MVVGGSSGIGRATSLLLKSLGAHVLATGRSDTHIEETLKLDPGISFLKASLPEDSNKVVNWVRKSVDTLHGVVFSQGIIYTEPFETFRDHELEEMWKVNVNLPLRFCVTYSHFLKKGEVLFLCLLLMRILERLPLLLAMH